MTVQNSKPQPGSPDPVIPAGDDAQTPAARSIVASGIARGVTRMLMAQGIGAVGELPLPDGRRADIVGLSASGLLSIIEIKSSVADFRCDQKWHTYRAYCDRLYFAVAPDFPIAILPDDTGLIFADRYGASIVRDAPEHSMAAARRKVMMLRFGRAAAARLARLQDPTADGMTEF